jgi:hypothetical protein
MAENDHVRRFNQELKTTGWMSVGCFVLNRTVFERLRGDDYMLEREASEYLAQDSQLMVWRLSPLATPSDRRHPLRPLPSAGGCA